MAIQMILCVETNKRADTDTIYINETIHRWYKLDNKVKISIINMNTKTRYDSKDVIREIAQKKKDYVLGESKVIYCIDTDQYEKNPEHNRQLIEISQYCDAKDYDLVWFCHDVEEVFLGRRVADSQKIKEAATFRRKKKIEEIPADKLSCDERRVCVSNILNILDKYLIRK